MAAMLFYENVRALNRDAHRNLRFIRKEKPFAFAARTNSVLVALTEFVEASRDFPIVFIGPDEGSFAAAALVGLRDSENVFVDENGNWEKDTYIPAFVRRYPFVLAEDGDQLTVCIDETSNGLSEQEGEAFFGEDGEPTAFLKDAFTFLQTYHGDMQRTKAFIDKLVEFELLAARTITAKQNDAEQVLDGLWIVDEEKFNALSDERIVQLQREGYLGLIYAHLFSLRNVNRLLGRVDFTKPLVKVEESKEA